MGERVGFGWWEDAGKSIALAMEGLRGSTMSPALRWVMGEDIHRGMRADCRWN